MAAYRRKIDSGAFWGSERGREFGKTLFGMIVVALYNAVKDCAEDATRPFFKRIGKDFLETLDLRAEAFLDDAAFRKEPVTDAQRAAMERKVGKHIRLKAWPSLAEKAFGLMNRCLKADQNLKVSEELTTFLSRNVKCGEWLGFYCANAMIRLRNWDGARTLLADVLRRKPNEAWAWTNFADACVDKPEDAAACLCKALTCLPRDPEIALGMAVKARRSLGRILSSLGCAEESAREIALTNTKSLPNMRNPFYLAEAKRAEKLVLGGKEWRSDDKGRKRFSGIIRKKAHPFGFVKDKTLGTVFVPPHFVSSFTDGQTICGMAVLKEDKKKNRMGWSMVSVLRNI